MKPFCIIADQIHLVSMLLILYKLYVCKNVKGLSFKSQILYAIVYATRYLDLFTDCISIYIRAMKIMYLTVKFTTVFLMYKEYKGERCSDDKFNIVFLLIPCFLMALLINYCCAILEVLWTFSVYLETVAILPQFVLLNNTGSADQMTSISLFLMGVYKLLYVTHWMLQNENGDYDLILIIPGVLQTALTFLTYGLTMF